MSQIKINRHRGGQVMILSIILLGGLLLGASAVAGLLTIYQIRGSNSAVDSTKAIFAADAGLEWATYRCYSQALCDPETEEDVSADGDEPNFTDTGASVEVHQYAVDAEGRWKFSAEGRAGQSVRLLEVTFGLEP